MSLDGNFKGKKPPPAPPPKPPSREDAPGPIYDPNVLREVTAELSAEENEAAENAPHPKGESREWINLPPLPPPPPQISPAMWLLRQFKRLVVIGLAIYLVAWAAGMLKPVKKALRPESFRAGTVPLPGPGDGADKADQELNGKLDEGRRDLASANLKTGVEKLEELAKDHPETVQGRKAMLALAATWRFQFNSPEQAIHWYRAYLEQDPNGSDAPGTMIRLADYLESLGRKTEAHALYEDLVNRFPKKPQADAARQGLVRTK